MNKPKIISALVIITFVSLVIGGFLIIFISIKNDKKYLDNMQKNHLNIEAEKSVKCTEKRKKEPERINTENTAAIPKIYIKTNDSACFHDKPDQNKTSHDDIRNLLDQNEPRNELLGQKYEINEDKDTNESLTKEESIFGDGKDFSILSAHHKNSEDSYNLEKLKNIEITDNVNKLFSISNHKESKDNTINDKYYSFETGVLLEMSEKSKHFRDLNILKEQANLKPFNPIEYVGNKTDHDNQTVKEFKDNIVCNKKLKNTEIKDTRKDVDTNNNTLIKSKNIQECILKNNKKVESDKNNEILEYQNTMNTNRNKSSTIGEKISLKFENKFINTRTSKKEEKIICKPAINPKQKKDSVLKKEKTTDIKETGAINDPKITRTPPLVGIKKNNTLQDPKVLDNSNLPRFAKPTKSSLNKKDTGDINQTAANPENQLNSIAKKKSTISQSHSQSSKITKEPKKIAVKSRIDNTLQKKRPIPLRKTTSIRDRCNNRSVGFDSLTSSTDLSKSNSTLSSEGFSKENIDAALFHASKIAAKLKELESIQKNTLKI